MPKLTADVTELAFVIGPAKTALLLKPDATRWGVVISGGGLGEFITRDTTDDGAGNPHSVLYTFSATEHNTVLDYDRYGDLVQGPIYLWDQGVGLGVSATPLRVVD